MTEMKNGAKLSRPLKLDGAHNVRDLGVYENVDGVKLKEHQFLRADGLHSLTPEDQEKLYAYGVRAVIDLRSRMEAEQSPCVWEGSDSVQYYGIPLLDEINSNQMKGGFPDSMSQLYVGLLEKNKEEFAQMLKISSEYPSDCVLFHCTAGKDRTGVTAMLLLGLADVDRDVIVADYSASGQYMDKVFAKQKEQMLQFGIHVPAYVLESRPEEMEKTLTFLQDKYGGIHGYLRSLPLEREVVEIVRRKMTGQRTVTK